jgi:hypothetical protein
MQKILENGIGMDHYLTPEVLIEGITLAETYSIFEDFALAHSVFSCIFPKLCLLSDEKYASQIIYGYTRLGLHYMRQGLGVEAYSYLSLACKGLVKLGRHLEADRLNPHIDKAWKLANERSCVETAWTRRAELEHIEMSRGNVLLKTIAHDRIWNTAAKDNRDKDDFETDTSSCKYGLTYLVSDITGISDSVFMVP